MGYPDRNFVDSERNVSVSLADSLAIEGINAGVSEKDGIYTILLDQANAVVLEEFLTSYRDARNARIRNG